MLEMIEEEESKEESDGSQMVIKRPLKVIDLSAEQGLLQSGEALKRQKNKMVSVIPDSLKLHDEQAFPLSARNFKSSKF